MGSVASFATNPADGKVTVEEYDPSAYGAVIVIGNVVPGVLYKEYLPVVSVMVFAGPSVTDAPDTGLPV
jgi:hypothetical protein